MLHLETAASANILMLVGCVLGAGFMIRFLVALSLDGKMHSAHAVRPGGLHYAADGSRLRARHRAALANSASHLAIGVVRITTALAWNTGSRSIETAVGRLQVAQAGKAGREVDVTAGRRYRSG